MDISTTRLIYGAVFAAALLHVGSFVQAGPQVAVRATPNIAFSNSTVHIRADVVPDAANRALEIVADSPDFYRSSLIPLNGEAAARVTYVDLKALPPGKYHVTATLMTATGRRVMAEEGFKIVSPGE